MSEITESRLKELEKGGGEKMTLPPELRELVRGYRRTAELEEALKPFAKIADAYDEDGLDECRPSWVQRGIEQFDSSKELYCGRGGKTLITLLDVIRARLVLTGMKYELPSAAALLLRAKAHFEALYIGGITWKEMSEDRQNEYIEKFKALEKRV